MTRRAIIAALGLLAIPSLSSQAFGKDSSSTVRTGEHKVPFQVRDGLVYIQAQVNGSRATLLVDTGAILTTFTLKIVPSVNSDSTIMVNLAKGSVAAYRVPVGFTFGDPDLGGRCSFRQSAIVGDFKFIDADGLVGLDVLNLFKSVTFDFKNSVLILEDR